MLGCSTSTNRVYFIGIDNKCSTVAVFLDISKAKKTTWYTGLIYKLLQMSVPEELVKVIDSYLAHRSFRVMMDGATSEWKLILVGVPQGSTIFSMLYI
jgi:Reverse transcriptase (RNA-dependent DNA polymerase).